MNTEVLNEQESSELVWWASVDSSTQDQTVFLSRKEAGQQSLLDRISIDPDTMPTFEDFQMAVKELHGGGIYEAVIRTPRGALARRIPFSLAGLPKKVVEPVQAAPNENGQEKLIALLIQQGQQMQQQFLAGLKEIGQAIAAKPEKPEIDPFELMERAANILGKTGATPPPQKSLVEQITELKTAADLIGLGSLSGEGSGEGWGSIAAALAPLAEMMKESTINERLKLQMQAQAQAKQQQQTPQQPPAAIAAPVAQPVNNRAKFLNDLKSVLTQVMPYVEQGADPQAVAQALLNAVPKNELNELYTFLNRDDALANMAALEPKIEQHWDWFSQLANAILTHLEPSNDETRSDALPVADSPTPQQAPTGNGQTGNAANAPTNGAASPKRARKSASAGNGVTGGQVV